MVMEKAYAQWKGGGNTQSGYTTLDEGGYTSDVLFALTGQDSTSKSAGDYSLSELGRMQRNGQAITFSSLAKGNGSTKPLYTAKNGLVEGHAYYVSSVDEKNRTVTIQNPWGWDEHKVVVPFDQIKNNFRQITTNPLTR